MFQVDRFDLPRSTPSAFRLEECLVRPTLNRIERGVEVIQLEPRVMQVLLHLASRPNHVFSRQELFQSVWADSVVCEEALTRTISELRRVFRDDTKSPRVIETIRKGGYRLIAKIEPLVELAAQTSDDAERPSPPLSPVPLPSIAAPRPRATLLKVGVALGGVLAAAVAMALLRDANVANTPRPPLETVPLTSVRGLELFPALSPNGAMLAYCWSGRDGGDASALDLYVMKVRDADPIRLTNLPGSETYPTWSPDGSEIAFLAEVDGGGAICTVSVAGGNVRERVRLPGTLNGLDWTPDGGSLLFASDAGDGTQRIRALHLDDLSVSTITNPKDRIEGDAAPAVSPEGRGVAFIRLNERGDRSLCWASLGGGELRTLNLGGRRVSGVDWLSPRQLVVSAASKIDYGLWTVSLDTGRLTPLATPGGRMQRISLAHDGGRLAYEKLTFAQRLWCVDLAPDRRAHVREEPLVPATQRDMEPVFSPDGRSIAFVSDRSGSPEVWITNLAGEDPRRVTDHRSTMLIHPRWAPDGSAIAYSVSVNGTLSIYVTDLASEIARRIDLQEACTMEAWARRDGCLYYSVDRATGWEAWRIDPDNGVSTRFGPDGVDILGESPDGRGLYCLRTRDAAIEILPWDGSSPFVVVPGEIAGAWAEIAAAAGGFFVTRKTRERSILEFYDLAAERTDSLATLPWFASSLSLAPDRSALLYDSIGGLEIDLMMTSLPD